MNKTYKVTYYTKSIEIAEVTTYHNIDNQSTLLDWIYNNIQTREYLNAVKCVSEATDYTEAVNDILEQRAKYPEIFCN